MGSMLKGFLSQNGNHRHRPTLFDRHPGQAIVLVAFLMIVLVGFTGLAIDGGELYYLQRSAQNAADAAVLASVYELCQDPNRPQALITYMAVQAGLESALENGFDNDGVTNWVTITTPAVPPGGGSASVYYVTVNIRAKKPSRLIQVVYQGPLEVTVQTAANCTPATIFAQGRALMSIGPCMQPQYGMDFTGSGATVTGGIWSNGDARVQGNNGAGGGSTVNGGAGSVGSVTSNNASFNPPSSGGGTSITVPPFWTIQEFQAPNGGVYKVANGLGQYYYHNGNVNSWSDFAGSGHPKAGIYYINGDIALNSADLNGVTLNGVTIVATGTITMSFGNSSSSLIPWTIPPDLRDNAGVAVLPALFSNSGAATCDNSTNNNIKTTGHVSWLGVIYAPYGECNMTFPDGTSLDGAVICFRVNLSGSNFTINYDPDLIPPIAPIVGVTQ